MGAMREAVRHPGQGCVVEFMHGNKPQLAWVLEEQSGKYRLLTLNKREMKLQGARLLSWAGPQYNGEFSRQDILTTLASHQEQREALEQSIDPLEIWELAQGEVPKASVEWFAELLWDKDEARDVEKLAAIGRAMLNCKTHFKFQPPDFEIFTEEKVEARLAEKKAAEERERIISEGKRFFHELWALRCGKAKSFDPPREEDIFKGLENLLHMRMANPDDSVSAALWSSCAMGLPPDPHMPLLLAMTWGIVPEHHNYLLDQAGYEPGDAWSEQYAGEVAALKAACEAEQQEPAPTPFVSIDSESTRDIDDAFFIERIADGSEPDAEESGKAWRVQIALACPALFLASESRLGKAVSARATSLYLPEGNSHMMPEALGTGLFSLYQGEVRPSLVLDIALDSEGEFLSCEPRIDWVRLKANLAYTDVEKLFVETAGEEGPSETVRENEQQLRMGYELSELLKETRLKRGAVIIERDDPTLTLKGEGAHTEVIIEAKEQCPVSMGLVSELMILANSALAIWAENNDVPLYLRTQAVSLPKDSAGIWREPADVHRIVKVLGSSLLETVTRPHASLGVRAYSPITSPLRRYPDFVNQEQTVSFLQLGTPKYERQTLAEMLPSLNARLEAVGRAQRFRPRYWKLLYFKMNCKKKLFDGVVVEENQNFVTVALPLEQIMIRGPRNMFSEKLYPGLQLKLRLGRIDPLNNEIHVLEALEE